MKLAKEAVMHIDGGVEVSMALILASGAKEEFAAFAFDPLSGLIREPHAESATTSTILRSPMRIDFDADHPNAIGFFFRQLFYFAFQFIALFPIDPPRLPSP